MGYDGEWVDILVLVGQKVGMDMTQVKMLIAGRRSVKPLLMDAERAVDEALWQELFECANWAPTHGLTEPWRFKVYRGEGRGALASALQEAYRQETLEIDFREDKWVKMGVNPMLAHAVVAVVMKREIGGKIPEIEEIEAVACSVQNFHLAASSVGLGVFWSSPAVAYGESFARFLNLSAGERCLGLLYIGWPKEGQEWPLSRRGDWREKVQFLGDSTIAPATLS